MADNGSQIYVLAGFGEGNGLVKTFAAGVYFIA
jgi:hypothetical protein